MVDSDLDEVLVDESESTISLYELDNSSFEDNDSLIEELDRNSIDEWQWKVTHISLRHTIIWLCMSLREKLVRFVSSTLCVSTLK